MRFLFARMEPARAKAWSSPPVGGQSLGPKRWMPKRPKLIHGLKGAAFWPRGIKSSKGLSLMEVVIAFSMLGVLLAAFTYSYFLLLRNHSYQNQRFDLRQTAIWALENISQDLHQATELLAPADVNTLTLTLSSYETITYALQSAAGTTQLIRTYTLNTSPVTTKESAVAKNVSSFALAYYNSNGTELTSVPLSAGDRANVRLIKITLILQSILWSNTQTWTLRTEVRPRNL